MDAGNEMLVFSTSSSNNTKLCSNITIINDAILEPDQFFLVLLSTADPDVKLRNNVSIITIVDDGDSKLKLSKTKFK